MKTKLTLLFVVLALLSSINQTAAQNTRFFRISGPAATTITAFNPDGTLVWTNTPTNATFTVQTATSLGGGTNWVDYVQIPATNAANTNLVIAFHPASGMVLIPAGSYTMGDNLDGESDAPVHTVYISAFYMDQYDVTWAQYQKVFNWATNHGYYFNVLGKGKAANQPVESVGLFTGMKWCNARSEMEGKTPAYYTSPAQTAVYRTGDIDASNACVKWNAGYRIPTEAEWEKAARGGLSGQRFPWGNTISWNQANYCGYPLSLGSGGYDYDLAPATDIYEYDPTFETGASPYMSPAGYFAPNGYGLYDMAGNIYQGCWDYYGAYGSNSDPHGPASGDYRVIRGGSWNSDAHTCRVACRIRISGWDDMVGFRCVLPLGQ